MLKEKNKEKTADEPAKTIPDNLARLFEMTTEGCAAVCFIKNKILISDNTFKNQDQNTEKTRLMHDVMQYFSSFKDGEFNINRDDTFSKICESRINGEEQGKLNILNDKIVNDIVKIVLSIAKGERDAEFSKLKRSLPRQYRKEAALAFEICDSLMHDFVNIEDFMKNNPEHDLTKAFLSDLGRVYIQEVGDQKHGYENVIRYEDYKLTNDQSRYGFMLVNANNIGENNDPRHAELQIIDYLIFTDNFKENIYVGISKLCCAECATVIESCNGYMGKDGKTIRTGVEGKDVTDTYAKDIKVIEVRGSHKGIFKTTPPHFLKYLSSKTSRTSKERALKLHFKISNASEEEASKGIYFHNDEYHEIGKRDLDGLNKKLDGGVFIRQDPKITQGIRDIYGSKKLLKSVRGEYKEPMQEYSASEDEKRPDSKNTKDTLKTYKTKDLINELIARSTNDLSILELLHEASLSIEGAPKRSSSNISVTKDQAWVETTSVLPEMQILAKKKETEESSIDIKPSDEQLSSTDSDSDTQKELKEKEKINQNSPSSLSGMSDETLQEAANIGSSISSTAKGRKRSSEFKTGNKAKFLRGTSSSDIPLSESEKSTLTRGALLAIHKTGKGFKGSGGMKKA